MRIVFFVVAVILQVPLYGVPSPRIACMLISSPSNWETKVKAVNETWLKKCYIPIVYYSHTVGQQALEGRWNVVHESWGYCFSFWGLCFVAVFILLWVVKGSILTYCVIPKGLFAINSCAENIMWSPLCLCTLVSFHWNCCLCLWNAKKHCNVKQT